MRSGKERSGDKMTKSEEYFERACRVIPGGVNSPVRAFGSVGRTPRMIKSAHGAWMTDEDGNRYLDFVSSWGPMILGHDNPEVREAVIKASEDGLSFGAATLREVEMAELITSSIPNIDMVRMVNSGTEAVMSALRVARGFTGRDKIVKFMGCYHGHADALLVQAGSGASTLGVPDSAGVPAGCTNDTLLAIYNDLESVEKLFDAFPDQIAAVIVEPVGANMGVVPPKEGFLEGLRALCTKHGALLIFDEVITGFRLGFTGAQGTFGVDADLVTYGKIIGAGMPVGAYGGKQSIMECVAPLGSVYQAGTLSGNPVAMAAGLTQLKILKENPKIYEDLNEKSQWFFDEIRSITAESSIKARVNSFGSLGCIFFTGQEVTDYASAKTSDTQRYADYFGYMLDHGVYLAPAQFEAMFLSAAHKKEELQMVLDLIRDYFQS